MKRGAGIERSVNWSRRNDRSGDVFSHTKVRRQLAVSVWNIIAAVVASAIVVVAAGLGPLSGYTQTLLMEGAGLSMAGLGIVVMMGYGGLVSLSQASFMAIGAYGVGIAITKGGISFWPACLIAVAVAIVAGLLIGGMSSRIGGHYLAMLTIAVQEIISLFLNNSSFTGGSNGISGITRPFIGPVSLMGNHAYLIFAGSIVTVSGVIVWYWSCSGSGRELKAQREDRSAAEAMGVDTFRLRVVAFTLGSVLAAIGGIIYAGAYQYIGPGDFSLTQSVTILAVVIIGGMESIVGAIAISMLLVFLPQWLQVLGQGYLILYGIAVMGFVMWRSKGLVGGMTDYVARRLSVVKDNLNKTRKHRFTSERVSYKDRNDLPIRAVIATKDRYDSNAVKEKAIALRADGITMRFGGVLALDDVSIKLKEGCVHGLLGPNGSGKTTFVNILSGLYRPSSGSVVSGSGKSLRGSPHNIARCGVARTFQLTRLYRGLTVFDNVAVAAEVGKDRAENTVTIADIAWDVLKFVGLEAVAEVTAGTLSYGQQRYVELARAAALLPNVLLLDEPGAGISSEEKRELGGLIKLLTEQGIAVLLVEHDVGFVRGLASEITVLNFGRVIGQGNPEEVLESEVVAGAYFGVK